MLAAALTLLLAPAVPLHAQAATGQPYTGPRFPGGPDSLRAYLLRHPLRQVGKGPVFVQFDVLPADRRHKPHVVLPPGRKALSGAATSAVLRLVADMPEWTPGRQDDTPITTVTLCLNEASPALPYADEMPVLPGMEPGIIGIYRYLPNIQVVTPEIVRHKLTGDVYMYFEVSETGHLENARVIGGEVPALNDAALLTVAPRTGLPERCVRGSARRAAADPALLSPRGLGTHRAVARGLPC